MALYVDQFGHLPVVGGRLLGQGSGGGGGSGPVPSTPYSPTIASGVGQFTIVWNDPLTLADGTPVGSLTLLTIYWTQTQFNAFPGGTGVSSSTVLPGFQTFNKTGLGSGTTWYVAVSATNAAGESDVCAEQTVLTS